MSIIKITDLSFSYLQDTPVLKDVNLEIEKGEWVSILGHNGSGKSTLSKLIIGLLKADKGEIVVDGITLTEETVYDVRKKIGIVFQNPDNQFVGVTVEDDIAFGMENLQFEKEEMLEKIDLYATKVNMKEYLKKAPHMLSGGQKQRVAIAGILAMNTDIIIFDEATSALDSITELKVMKSISELNEKHTIIIVAHRISTLKNCNIILQFENGEIVKTGTFSELYPF